MKAEGADQVLVRWVEVRFSHAGFHYWPRATVRRAYLLAEHRHLFIVTVRVFVKGDDREVEFHDLLELAEAAWPGTGENREQLGTMSCEQIAEHIARSVAKAYRDREVTVMVSEDGECTGGVSLGFRERQF